MLIGTERFCYRLLARYVALFRIRYARKTSCAEESGMQYVTLKPGIGSVSKS